MKLADGPMRAQGSGLVQQRFQNATAILQQSRAQAALQSLHIPQTGRGKLLLHAFDKGGGFPQNLGDYDFGFFLLSWVPAASWVIRMVMATYSWANSSKRW